MYANAYTEHLHAIARAYDAAPDFDPDAVPAWRALADDSLRRADRLARIFDITVVDDPEPYPDALAMFCDLDRGRFLVSRANCDHPLWTVEQNVAFRIVHDVAGHYPSGGDFSWLGENRACGAHFPMLAPLARVALFTECIAQTAFANAFGYFGPQKVAVLA